MAMQNIFLTGLGKTFKTIRLSRFTSNFRTGRTLAVNCLGLAAGLALAVLSSSCASTSVKSTWRSPDFQGQPPQKVAVVADDDRAMVRVGLENRFVNHLAATGQPAFATASAFPDLVAARKNK
jgi:hypothetical protein